MSERNGVESMDWLAELVDHWERKTIALDRLALDAVESNARQETIDRLKTKAGVTRSMTVELKREIQQQLQSVNVVPPLNA